MDDTFLWQMVYPAVFNCQVRCHFPLMAWEMDLLIAFSYSIDGRGTKHCRQNSLSVSTHDCIVASLRPDYFIDTEIWMETCGIMQFIHALPTHSAK